MNFNILRKNMVDSQLKPNKIINEDLINAFLKVPREIFVTKKNINQSYIDDNIDLSKNRFLINPMIISRLIQSLEIEKNDTILVLGSNVGYTSVILSYLCNTVIGIESIKSFCEFSSNVLLKLDVNNVAIIKGKIENGFPDQTPYENILIEGGVNFVPDVILSQLTENGKLVTVEIDKNNIGKAVIYKKKKNNISKRYLFDAYVPLLDVFKHKISFKL